MIDIQLIPHEVKVIAQGAAKITKQIEADLQSNIVTDLAALFPGGTELDNNLIAACDLAIKGCVALGVTADTIGQSARLQRLGADLTRLQHDGEHGISHYITWFEIVFNDIFGK